MSIDFIGPHKVGDFSLFLLMHEPVSGSFQSAVACSGFFSLLQETASQSVLSFKFTINQLHVDFITKWN